MKNSRVKQLTKTAKFIKKTYIKGSFVSFNIPNSTYYRYEYYTPCECGASSCAPEQRISVGIFTKEEINFIFERLNE